MGSESTAPNLTALPVDQVAKLLRHAGSERLSEDAIRADIAAGAPTNADGSMNLVVYGAWLVRELARRGAARE
jgi:hypothetical protein